MEISLHKHDWLNHWLLMTGSIISSSAFLRSGLGCWKFQIFNRHGWFLWQPDLTLKLSGDFQPPSHLINIHKDSYYLGDSKGLKSSCVGNHGLRPNVTKEPLIIPITQEVIRILEALCQELGGKTKYIFLMMSQRFREPWLKLGQGGSLCQITHLEFGPKWRWCGSETEETNKSRAWLNCPC